MQSRQAHDDARSLTLQPRLTEGITAIARPKKPMVGRNDPCWCGSGKKYKKCHLGKDSAT